MDNKTERELMDGLISETMSEVEEVKSSYEEISNAACEWIKDIYGKLFQKTYDTHVFMGYLHGILGMNGGEFTLPSEVRRKNHRYKKFQIEQIENEDGSCTLKIKYVEEENE